MGTQDSKREAASERRARKAEKDRNGGKLASLFTQASGGAADWGSAHPARVLEVVVAMQGVGGAVTFGLSRDGGAYMLTFLLDGDRKTEWLSGSEDVDVWLEQLTYMIRTVGE